MNYTIEVDFITEPTLGFTISLMDGDILRYSNTVANENPTQEMVNGAIKQTVATYEAWLIQKVIDDAARTAKAEEFSKKTADLAALYDKPQEVTIASGTI